MPPPRPSLLASLLRGASLSVVLSAAALAALLALLFVLGSLPRPLIVPVLFLGAAALGVLWWRRTRPAVRDAPAFAAAIGFRRRQKSFLGRAYDAGEPASLDLRGRRVTVHEIDRPTGPGDAELTLVIGATLHRPAPGFELAPWLARQPALAARLDAAGPGCRWEIDDRRASVVCLWDDPRALDWTSARLKVSVEALVELAGALDER